MTGRLYAAQQGSGAKTVVFLHGFGGCHGIWREIAAPLADTERTLAYDLPGHGRSLDFPGAGPARLAARAILADLTARGVEKAHVVGHSMGGAVAALMALAAPERVASLTLLAPGGFGEEINGALLRRYAGAVEDHEIRDCLVAMSGPEARVSGDAVDNCLEMRNQPGQREKLVEIAAAITRDDRQGMIPRDLLAALTMPVAVMWGTHDPVLPVSQAGGLPAGFELRRVPNAGHMLASEAPGLVSDLVRDTTNRRAGPARAV